MQLLGGTRPFSFAALSLASQASIEVVVVAVLVFLALHAVIVAHFFSPMLVAVVIVVTCPLLGFVEIVTP